VIDTARLVGRRPDAGELEALGVVVRDPRLIEWLWPDVQAPRPEQLLARFRRHWDEHGFGVWIFRERASDDPIGYGGAQHTTVEDRAEVEVLYGVTSARWGEGFATEIARAAVAHTEFAELVCFTRTDNLASRRVMEKAGFRYEHDFERAGLPRVLYRLQRRTERQELRIR
jgi:RimJ/RimL family protein N-acetyltransferase